MDFKKIEWIFLFVFIGIDIFLGCNYLQNFHILKLNNNYNENTIQKLRNNNVSFNELSNNKSSEYYVASKNNSQIISSNIHNLQNQHYVIKNINGEEVIYSRFNRKIILKNNENLIYKLNKIINNKNMILFGNRYYYCPELSNEYQKVFTEKLSNINFFDKNSQLVFYINKNNNIIGYKQGYVYNPKKLYKRQTIISKRDAILSLYTDNQISNNSNILWIKLVYSWILNTNGYSIYVPCWCVGIRNKNNKNINIKCINAFNSSLINY